MTDNMFDDFVRGKLGDHESPVPQGLWEKIERKKDKDPKGGFLLPRSASWATLLYMLAAIGVCFLVFQDTTVPAKSTGATGKNGGTAVADGSATANNGTSDKAGPAVPQNAGNTLNDNNPGNGVTATVPATNTGNINDRSTGDANNTSTAVNTQPAPAKNNSINDNNTRSATDVSSTGNKTSKVKRGWKNKGLTIVDNAGDDASGSYAVVNNGNNRKNGKMKNADRLAVVPGKPGTGNNAAAGDNNTVDPASDAALANTKIMLQKGVTAYGYRYLAPNTKDQFDLSRITLFGIDCPTTEIPRRNDWYVEVYGSPDKTMKSVTAKSNDAYVQKKDSTETQQGGFTAGIRLSKSIGENLLLKTGLQYSQVNERFDLRTENERRITTVITIRTIITAGGVDSTIRDTTTVEQIGYRLQRTYNRYRSLDIPLLLSYEFGSDNLKFAVNGGVILNLHSWYNGQTLNDSMTVVSLNSKSAPVYKQNIGLGLYGGFSIIKPVANKFDIFLEPYFRYNLSNMATGSAYTQKISSGGISLGIRYKFKGQRRGVK